MGMYHFAAEIPASLEAAWPLMEFSGPGWTITEKGPREFGAVRTMELPQGRIVDRLVAYSAGRDRCSFTYALIEETVFGFGLEGYEGTFTLIRNTQDPARCFCVYTGRWAKGDDPRFAGAVEQQLAGMIQQLFGAQAG